MALCSLPSSSVLTAVSVLRFGYGERSWSSCSISERMSKLFARNFEGDSFFNFKLSLIRALRLSWSSKLHSWVLNSFYRYWYICSLVSKCLQGIGNVQSGHLPSHRACDFRFEAAFYSLSNLWSSSLATMPSFVRCVRLIMLLFSIYFISMYWFVLYLGSFWFSLRDIFQIKLINRKLI